MLVKTAVLEAVHHIVIHLLRIEVLRTVADGGERGDTTGQSFLNEVVAKVHVVLLTHGDGNIDRTRPVALCNHLEHHEITLVQGVLSFQGDHHLVWDGILGHHHTALLHGFLVDGDIDRVGGNEVQVLILGAHPILQDVLQFKRILTELFLGFLWILLVVIQ